MVARTQLARSDPAGQAPPQLPRSLAQEGVPTPPPGQAPRQDIWFTSPRALVDIVAGADIAALTLVSGVGKKTAERLLIELKNRLLAGLTHMDALLRLVRNQLDGSYHESMYVPHVTWVL